MKKLSFSIHALLSGKYNPKAGSVFEFIAIAAILAFFVFMMTL